MSTPADPPRPRTPAQVEGARRNGALSRGPVTAEGKARSARNALKHGLRSAEFGLLPDEDAEAWEAHLAGIRATYRPQDPVEVHLIAGIAVAQWRELRADRVEADVMSDIRPAFAVSVRPGFQLPTSPAATVEPSVMSVRRDMPRHMTVLPGGGSRPRAR